MSLTLGLTGMDQATEAALKSSFSEGGARLDPWALKSEAEAEYVIVDMDSMYGPMSWLRLHAAGKRVIGLTTAPRTQADYRLARPFNPDSLRDLLSEIALANGTDMAPVTQAAIVAPTPAPEPIPVAPPPAPAPVAAAPVIPVAAPVAAPATVAAVVAPPLQAPPPTPPAIATPAPPVQPAAQATVQATEPLPAPASAVPASGAEASPARGANFVEWLRPGALSGRARYQSGKGPVVLIDFIQRQYFGPATLKPLAEYFVGSVGLRDFEQLDDQGWKTTIAAAGGDPQPLSRLQWFGALLAGEGRLMPGFSPDGKFMLNKWPQTEREYPRHFRIATAMMKGPMTIGEIATASGVPATDVIDFINANLTTGFAEPAGAAADAEAAKGSLLGLLRGR